MIHPETRVQIRRYFYAEHWKIGTIASQLKIHPDAVRQAIESEKFHRAQSLRGSIIDPYLEFVRQTLDQYPKLRATRIHQMIRDRGYTGSIVQLRRTVASLRPPVREAFLRLHTFPAEQAQVDWAHFGQVAVGRGRRNLSCFVLSCRIRALSIWSSSSINKWRISCVAMSMPLKTSPANLASFSTTTSVRRWWNAVEIRFTSTRV